MEYCNTEVTLKIEAVVVSEITWFSQKFCSHIQWKQWVRYIYPDRPLFSTQGGRKRWTLFLSESCNFIKARLNKHLHVCWDGQNVFLLRFPTWKWFFPALNGLQQFDVYLRENLKGGRFNERFCLRQCGAFWLHCVCRLLRSDAELGIFKWQRPREGSDSKMRRGDKEVKQWRVFSQVYIQNPSSSSSIFRIATQEATYTVIHLFT